MLPARSRLTRRDEFASAVRRGRRSGRSRLVVHLLRGADRDGPRAGFVVSRAVGGSVVRKRVVRRLRHLVAARLVDLPGDVHLVVRALPPAAEATSAELAGDLDTALRTAGRPPAGRSPRRPPADPSPTAPPPAGRSGSGPSPAGPSPAGPSATGQSVTGRVRG